MPSLLSIKNLLLGYDDKPVIRDVSLEIAAGQFVGLIGPNGAGKTTLLLSISGQFAPQAGEVLFEGQDIYKANLAFKRQIGFVHESPFFYPHLTCEEFLVFVARLHNMPKTAIVSRIGELLEHVNLTEERDKLTAQLSQGMRKKLAIAAAVLPFPKILFLDEALNGVDVESAFHIKKLLVDFVEAGGTVILSTHVLEVIEKICDRYVVLQAGRLIADLNATDIDPTQHTDLEARVLDLLKSSAAQ